MITLILHTKLQPSNINIPSREQMNLRDLPQVRMGKSGLTEIQHQDALKFLKLEGYQNARNSGFISML